MGTTLSDPLVGQTLDGRYQVVRRLARGGMATVYEALDTRLERTVALKVMHPGLAEDKAFVERFIREARSAARLSHPGVVAVYDQSADSGHVFLAMEYVAGRNLREWLREKGRLTPREAFAVLEPVLAALGAAHDAGIIHRDIKPENVLIADDGRVKVADFGLARAVSTSSATGTALIGTVAYLAPEQVERGVADQRSDVYAAGILLFEMLTGLQPFGGETPIQVAYQHVNYDVPAPSAHCPGLPQQLDDLVARATRRSPDARPATATAFLTEAVAARRSLTQAQLDEAGPPDPADPVAHTLVVPRNGAPVPPPAPMPAVAAHRAPPQHTAPLPGTGGRGGQAANPYDVPQKFARRRRRGMLALVLLLAGAVALGVGAWRIAAGGSIAAPSLVGLSQSEATAKAKQLGLDVDLGDKEFSETFDEGEVIRTDPGKGKRIGKHGTITLILSKGPQRFEVPEVAGASQESAEDAIREASLTVGDIKKEFSDSAAEGEVIRTEPAEGQELKKDSVVTLVVSKGAAVAVPDIVGQPVEAARVMLAQYGLTLAEGEQQYSDELPAGYVMAQKPTPDKKIKKGSTVTVTVSKGQRLVAVPSVIGMTADDAQDLLEDAGFVVSIQRPFFDFDRDPRVSNQNPQAGTQAAEGSQVTIFVGGG